MNPVQQELSYLDSSDDFRNGKIGLQWQWMGNAQGAAADAGKILYTPIAEGGISLGALNLSGEDDPVIWHSCNVLTQKLVLPEWTCEVRMRTDGLLAGNRAGITMMGGQYAALYARKNADGGTEIVYAESEGADKDKSEKILSVVPLAEAGTNEAGKDHEITFRISCSKRILPRQRTRSSPMRRRRSRSCSFSGQRTESISVTADAGIRRPIIPG